jgi:hypothetical protein
MTMITVRKLCTSHADQVQTPKGTVAWAKHPHLTPLLLGPLPTHLQDSVQEARPQGWDSIWLMWKDSSRQGFKAVCQL